MTETPQTRPPATGDAPRAWGPPSLLRLVGAAVAAGAFLALAGAFETSAIPLATRLAYWTGLMATGAVIGSLAGRYATPRRWLERRPLAATALIALSLSAPMSLVVVAAGALLNHRPLALRSAVFVFPSVLAVAVAMTAISYLLNRRTAETHAAPTGAPPPKFLERLPAKLEGAEIWAVEAEDHYLRLHTSKGQELILMRLSDAVRELEGIEGAQTHRSWWVSRDAVTGVERGDGRATLTLKDGTLVPVSRACAKTLRGAGWF